MSDHDSLASLESIVKPLLEAANTDHWRNSLNVLYLSGQDMAFSEDLRLPCLLSAKGPFEDIELSADLLRGNKKVTTNMLGKEFIPIILPRIVRFFNTDEVKAAITEEKEDAFLSLWMGLYNQEVSDIQRELYQLLIQGASSISDWAVVEIFDARAH